MAIYTDPSLSADRLVLGTAQLGLNYGISNRYGKPNREKAEAVVEAAWSGGIRIFDTAHAYGESEKILGQVICRLGMENQIRVISKIGEDQHLQTYEKLEAAIDRSLERLQISSLHCLMLHKEALIDTWSTEMAQNLERLVGSGLVRRVGISVYSPQKALRALDTELISDIQIPSNVWDRRFEQAGVFQHATDKAKTVYVRSIFLQGLLLMDPQNLPVSMAFAKTELNRLNAFSKAEGIRKTALLLGYAKRSYPDAHVIFGAESARQVRDNLAAWNADFPDDLAADIRDAFPGVSERILNPARWPKVHQPPGRTYKG